MSHGEDAHTSYFEGRPADKVAKMRQSMDAYAAEMMAEQT